MPFSSSPKRVVITGLGVISPNGVGGMKFWDALMNGISGIRKISQFNADSYPSRIAGEVADFDPKVYIPIKKARRMARPSQFAVAASKMALEDARVSVPVESGVGVLLGSSVAMMELAEKSHSILVERGLERLPPTTALEGMPHAATAAVANSFGCSGPSMTVASSCLGGLHAIGYARDLIRYGISNWMIAGGVEAPITPLVFGSLCRMGIISEKDIPPSRVSRPFDKTRDGGVLGEGTAIFILEELDHAIKRGVPIYGELVGYATNTECVLDQTSVTTADALAQTIAGALHDAQIAPTDIDYVCAHAPSDPLLDVYEVQALKKALGYHAYRIPVSSIKSMIGNPLAAAGPLQVAASLLAMRHGWVPPTINYEHPDPECDLDCVPNQPRRHDVNVALVNSHGFGGINASIILKRYVE